MKNYENFIKESKKNIKWYNKGKFEPDENFDIEEEEEEFDPEIGIENLVGRTLIDIDVNEGKSRIIFTTKGGNKYMMYHEQDCCESVSIDDIIGDIKDLIGTPIIRSSEDTNNDDPPENHDDSWTWTFYNIATIKGHVTIRWFGTSNGYYSESVDFIEIDENGRMIK